MLPKKLKNIDIASLEMQFAAVVDKIVNGAGEIEADIQFIDFSPEKGSSDLISKAVEMKIRFFKKFDASWLSDKEKGQEK